LITAVPSLNLGGGGGGGFSSADLAFQVGNLCEGSSHASCKDRMSHSVRSPQVWQQQQLKKQEQQRKQMAVEGR
jgi:hypothetical protein